jgi:hypothetical protein
MVSPAFEWMRQFLPAVLRKKQALGRPLAGGSAQGID